MSICVCAHAPEMHDQFTGRCLAVKLGASSALDVCCECKRFKSCSEALDEYESAVAEIREQVAGTAFEQTPNDVGAVFVQRVFQAMRQRIAELETAMQDCTQ